MTHAESIAEGERILAQDRSKLEFERVTGQPNLNPPLSIRLSSTLLERLDALATTQHRKRSNLIQHILWEYVRSQEDAPAVVTPGAVLANGKKTSRPKVRKDQLKAKHIYLERKRRNFASPALTNRCSAAFALFGGPF